VTTKEIIYFGTAGPISLLGASLSSAVKLQKLVAPAVLHLVSSM